MFFIFAIDLSYITSDIESISFLKNAFEESDIHIRIFLFSADGSVPLFG